MRGAGQAYEADVKVFVDEFSKCLKFGHRERIDRAEGWSCTFLKVDFEVVRSVRGEGVGSDRKSVV